MAPTLIRFAGEDSPKTDAGTIAGKPAIIDDAARPLPAAVRNWRREVSWRWLFFIWPRSAGPLDALRLLLRFEDKLRSEEAVCLRHCRLGPVDHVGDELLAIRQRHVAAV